MIRNLLASAILLAASTTAFAGDIADQLKVEGATASGVVTAALDACADTACKDDVIAQALEAGIDTASVMSIASLSGMPAADIGAALRSANVPEQDIVGAALANNMDATAIAKPTAGGPLTPTPGTGVKKPAIPAADVPAGTSPTK